MKKLILWCTALIFVLVVALAIAFWLSRPQVITLKDGTKLTLVGVDYGKHHVFKGIKATASHLRWRGRAMLDTTNDTLMVWIKAEKKGMQWPNFQLFVYDTANTACVASWQSTGQPIKSGVYVEGFALNAFPRRDEKIILRVASWGNYGGMRTAKGQFVISNPGPRDFPQWQPDPIPDTQSDGDLTVTLTRCASGARGFMYGNANTSTKDPMQKAVQVAFHVEQNGKVVSNWRPLRIETSDATGNDIFNNSWSNGRDTNGDATMTYQWGLWPEEPAWKLRVEMSRTSGFADSEVWAVTNVPVSTGTWQDLYNYQMQNRFGNFRGRNTRASPAFAETILNGIHLKIFPAIQTADQNWGMGQKPAGFRVSADPDLPDGYRMSLVKATDEQGHKLQTNNWGPNGGNGNFIFQLQNIRNAKSLNLTIAVHKSRFVEFTVKPTQE